MPTFHWLLPMFLLILVTWINPTDCHLVKFKNSCSKSLNVFSLENGPGKGKVSWEMSPGEETSRDFSSGWAGRFWARYGDVQPFDGWPQPDALAEIKFDGWMGLDFYDISLVDGFSVPLQMSPIPGTFIQDNSQPRNCKRVACLANLIQSCPEELQLKQNNRVVACQSSCTKFKKDEYCCTGAHNSASTCPQNHYGAWFKNACPDAYSYAFDDASSTFACKSAPGMSSGYLVEFCGF